MEHSCELLRCSPSPTLTCTAVCSGPSSCSPAWSPGASSSTTTPASSSSPPSRPPWTPWCLYLRWKKGFFAENSNIFIAVSRFCFQVLWCVTSTRSESPCSMNSDFMTTRPWWELCTRTSSRGPRTTPRTRPTSARSSRTTSTTPSRGRNFIRWCDIHFSYRMFIERAINPS